MVAGAQVPRLASVTGVILTVIFAIVAALFLKRTKANIDAGGGAVDLTNW